MRPPAPVTAIRIMMGFQYRCSVSSPALAVQTAAL